MAECGFCKLVPLALEIFVGEEIRILALVQRLLHSAHWTAKRGAAGLDAVTSRYQSTKQASFAREWDLRRQL